MRFTMDAHPGLADGSITLTFRRWTRPQVKVGGTYKAGESTLMVDEIREVRVAEISDAEAKQAGEPDREALLRRLGKGSRGRYGARKGEPVADDTVVYRIAFHRIAGDTGPALAEQHDLSAADIAEITRRLDRLDKASAHGPWTAATLRIIADNPAVVSTTLAEALGRERQSFKIDVRKLKRLGLTESLEVGYRLSPRGRAYLSAGVQALE